MQGSPDIRGRGRFSPVCQLVHVGHSRGVQQLVRDLLHGGAGGRVDPLDGHRGGAALVDGLEGVLNLVQPTLGGEDSDVTVKSSAAASRHDGFTGSPVLALECDNFEIIT